MNALRKLLTIAGTPLGKKLHDKDATVFETYGDRGTELGKFLIERNGFYAFESALLVRGLGCQIPRGVVEWNTPSLWIQKYDAFKLEPMLFFAEDIFGNQFAITTSQVVSFDPETAQTEIIGDSLNDWAEKILEQYTFFTGHPLASKWQQLNGAISPGMRLTPKIPFVTGGKYEIDNLALTDEYEAIAFRAEVACQIKDLPDGAEIKFNIE